MKRLDLDLLKDQIQTMTPQTKLYKLLKKELTSQNHWKNKPRGNPNINNLKGNE